MVKLVDAEGHKTVAQQKPDKPRPPRAHGEEQIERERDGEGVARDREMAFPRGSADAKEKWDEERAHTPEAVVPDAVGENIEALRHQGDNGQQGVQLTALVQFKEPALPA